MKSIYDKYDLKKKNAIKKKKTFKKQNNIIFNRRKTKKIKKSKNKKQKTLINFNHIISGGDTKTKEFKLLLNYLDKDIDSFVKHSNQFKKYVELFEQHIKLIDEKYISSLNLDATNILNRCINDGINLTVEEKLFTANKKFSSSSKIEQIKQQEQQFELLRNRMLLLNNIYRFSGIIGNNFKRTDRNFYYKHRSKRSTRFLKKSSDNSTIGKNFTISDNLWGMLAKLREYEFKVNKYRLLLVSLTPKITNQNSGQGHIQKLDVIKNDMKQENIPSNYEKLKTKFNEKMTEIKPIVAKFNEITQSKIYYYIPPVDISNATLILLNLPKKSKNKLNWGSPKNIAKSIGKVALTGVTLGLTTKTGVIDSRDEVNNRNINETSNKFSRDKHQEANNNIFDISTDEIQKYFQRMNTIYNNNATNMSYIERFIIFHNNYREFQSLNSLYIFDLEQKPYIDMGQISMLSYENNLKNDITESRNQQKTNNKNKPYLSNMVYFNNILHLPRFLLNEIKLIVLQNQGQLQNQSIDIRNRNTIINSNKIIQKINVSTEDLNIDIKKKIDRQKSTNTMDLDTAPSDIKKWKVPIQLPASCYHAFFKIKDMRTIQEINFQKFYQLFGKKKIFIGKKSLEHQEQLRTINSLFYINKKEELLSGTLIYLYKQIAYLSDFIFKNNENSLFGFFLKDILDNENYKSTQFKNIRRNTGIFNGILDKRIYLSYVMLVYIQHCNRLAECVSELEEVTRIIYDTYKASNEDKINNEYIYKFDKFEQFYGKKIIKDVMKESQVPYSVYNYNHLHTPDEKLNEETNIEYKEELSKVDYSYKKLLVKLKTEVFKNKSFDYINEFVQKIVPKLDSKSFTIRDFNNKIDNNELKQEIKFNNKKNNLLAIYKGEYIENNDNPPNIEFDKSIITAERFNNVTKNIEVDPEINTIEDELLYLFLFEKEDETNNPYITNLKDRKLDATNLSEINREFNESIKKKYIENNYNEFIINEKALLFKNSDLNDLLNYFEIIQIKISNIEAIYKQSTNFKSYIEDIISSIKELQNINKENKEKLKLEIKKEMDKNEYSSNNEFLFKRKNDGDNTERESNDKLNYDIEFTVKTDDIDNGDNPIFTKGKEINIDKNIHDEFRDHPSINLGNTINTTNLQDIIKKYNEKTKIVLIYNDFIDKMNNGVDSRIYNRQHIEKEHHYPYQFLLLKKHKGSDYLKYDGEEIKKQNLTIEEEFEDYFNKEIQNIINENVVLQNTIKIFLDKNRLEQFITSLSIDEKNRKLQELNNNRKSRVIVNSIYSNVFNSIHNKIKKTIKDKKKDKLINTNVYTEIFNSLISIYNIEINDNEIKGSEFIYVSDNKILLNTLMEAQKKKSSYNDFINKIKPKLIKQIELSINNVFKKYGLKKYNNNSELTTFINENFIIKTEEYNKIIENLKKIESKQKTFNNAQNKQDLNKLDLNKDKIIPSIFKNKIIEDNILRDTNANLKQIRSFADKINNEIKEKYKTDNESSLNNTNEIINIFNNNIEPLLKNIINKIKTHFVLIKENELTKEPDSQSETSV